MEREAGSWASGSEGAAGFGAGALNASPLTFFRFIVRALKASDMVVEGGAAEAGLVIVGWCSVLLLCCGGVTVAVDGLCCGTVVLLFVGDLNSV